MRLFAAKDHFRLKNSTFSLNSWMRCAFETLRYFTHRSTVTSSMVTIPQPAHRTGLPQRIAFGVFEAPRNEAESSQSLINLANYSDFLIISANAISTDSDNDIKYNSHLAHKPTHTHIHMNDDDDYADSFRNLKLFPCRKCTFSFHQVMFVWLLPHCTVAIGTSQPKRVERKNCN